MGGESLELRIEFKCKKKHRFLYVLINGMTFLCTCVPSRYYYEGEEEKGIKGCMTWIIVSHTYENGFYYILHSPPTR